MDNERIQPLRGTISLLTRRDLITVEEVRQVDLGVHDLPSTSEVQIIGEPRGRNPQVHGVPLVGPRAGVLACHETQRVGLGLPGVRAWRGAATPGRVTEGRAR